MNSCHETHTTNGVEAWLQLKVSMKICFMIFFTFPRNWLFHQATLDSFINFYHGLELMILESS